MPSIDSRETAKQIHLYCFGSLFDLRLGMHERKRYWGRIALSSIIVVVLFFVGLKFYLFWTPVDVLNLFESDSASGRAVQDVYDCAHHQRNLLGYIIAFKNEVGRPPQSLEELINHDTGAMAFDKCLLGPDYEYLPENYGKPDAVLIRERATKHDGTLYLWLHGLRPRVETTGDGTVHLFEDSDLITLPPKEKLKAAESD